MLKIQLLNRDVQLKRKLHIFEEGCKNFEGLTQVEVQVKVGST